MSGYVTCQHCGRLTPIGDAIMSKIVLGPYLSQVIEADPNAAPVPDAPTPVEPPRQKFDFDMVPTEPGGIVNLVLKPEPGTEAAPKPTKVFAFFVPYDANVDPATRTVDDIANSGAACGALEVAPEATTARVTVPGVTPGTYDVHTLFEYPA